ncbi:hypothetical protein C772_01455 [Bhargavaea cecembensis DSE10]|uniref:DUF2188 domain-containing protein n=1 Tax=Bhargavaea cecembensis DSE10 TaxID=1235279 RepID=M7NY02_9BACL|nr:DUF2188 domain-containing protein [Bhargavaea cecembensis]EMR06560.1 hypothetical protein C772_01455 [Bhargavaea cecembensis DSE10]
MGKNIHVIPVDDRWGVKAEGESEPSQVVDTQEEAFEIGRELAKQERSELLIHGEDGQIRERNTYGKDPFPPRG